MMMMPRSNFGFDLFDEMFKDPFFSRRDNQGVMMKTDIREQDNSYLLDIDLPGFAKEDISAELHDGYMTVTARRDENSEQKDEDGKYIHRERYSGSCSRRFYVGKNVNESDIKASFKDGTLHLAVPKEEPKKLEEQKKLISIE